MNRRDFLKCVSSTAIGTTLMSSSLAYANSLKLPKKRNILLILADDMGRELFSCYGGQSYKLPGFERFINQSMRFQTCYATPLCVPSRNEILTGRYSFRNYTNWEEMDFSQTTFANLMKKAGYATAIAGKWQMAGWSNKPYGIETAGFDEYCMFDYDEKNRFWGSHLKKNGELVQRGDPSLYGPDIYSDFLIDFMKRNHQEQKPFLAYYCTAEMHRPFQPTPDCPGAPKHGQQPPKDWQTQNGKQKNFEPMLKYADKMLTKLMDSLEKMGIADETLVIFTADNGTDNKQEAKALRHKFQNQIVKGGKYFPTELGVNVPFFVRCPDLIKSGSCCNSIIDFTDVLPTLCEVGQIKPPSTIQLDGRSILPLIKGKQSTPKPVVFTWGNYENDSRKYKKPQNHPHGFVYAVSDGQWKLYSDGRMFNVAQDPLEHSPVSYYADKTAKSAQILLHKKLIEILSSQPRKW